MKLEHVDKRDYGIFSVLKVDRVAECDLHRDIEYRSY